MRLAIIPARGGSKRIPGKNIRPFCEQPIIAYSIQTAIASTLFDRILVSTDSDEIATIAREYGAEVPFLRSSQTADDYSTLIDVLQEVVSQLASLGETYQEICCLLPTAPLVTAERLHDAYRLFTERGYDSVFPIVRFGYPIQRALSLTDAGDLMMQHPEYYTSRSQDLPASYHDAGQFYWFRPAPCFAAGRLFTDHCGGIEVSELEVQDIDTQTDWQLCELKFKLQRRTPC